MIINSSRGTLFQECRQKMWNWSEEKLLSFREANPLTIGASFHAGLAHYYTTRDLEEAKQRAEKEFREHLEGQRLLPEEIPSLEQDIHFVKVALEKHTVHWHAEAFEVLMPEVSFLVELPNTKHHCFFAHRLEHPEIPYDECPIEHNRKGQHWGDLRDETGFHCEMSHYFAGRTDAVVSWRKMVWLLEHKTTTRSGENFFDRFQIDAQTTGYLYGIWKQTQTRPHGFILNVVKKPYKNAANPFDVSFEREAFLRDEATLLQFEREITTIAEEFERAVRLKLIYKNTSSCVNYNRKCYYFDMCAANRSAEEGEFRLRSEDYVEKDLRRILNLV